MAERKKTDKLKVRRESTAFFDSVGKHWNTLHLREEDKIKPDPCDLRCMPAGYRRILYSCPHCEGNYSLTPEQINDLKDQRIKLQAEKKRRELLLKNLS